MRFLGRVKRCSPAGLDFRTMRRANPMRFPHIVEGSLFPDVLSFPLIPAPGAHDLHGEISQPQSRSVRTRMTKTKRINPIPPPRAIPRLGLCGRFNARPLEGGKNGQNCSVVKNYFGRALGPGRTRNQPYRIRGTLKGNLVMEDDIEEGTAHE